MSDYEEESGMAVCDCGHLEEDHANDDGSCIVCGVDGCGGFEAAP